MASSPFHFAQSGWLWGLIAIPSMLLLYALFQKAEVSALLERFADRHLLPHLVRNQTVAPTRLRRPLLLWSGAWALGVLAMAGPRWGYTDERAYEPARDLVIVLDLAQSMNATDVEPSRIARARQEIEDLLDMSHNDSIGLVAYAAVPHMVTPLTDDFRTIQNLLPELDTSLVTVQGDRLKPALQMAASMLKDDVGDGKSILVIGDGGFEENDIADLVQAADHATIYTMGIGLPASGLRADRLQALATAGHGLYVEANYTDSDTTAILNHMGTANVRAQAAAKGVRVWEERFYIPVLALAFLLLPFFRKGATFPIILLMGAMAFSPGSAKADTVADWFRNRNQQAESAYDNGDYKGAMAKFDTPYQRGVVAYRAKQYERAESLFKAAATRKARLNAFYDLGNAQLMQDEVEDAIGSYKAALKLQPDDVATQHNLAIALKLLAQEQQKQDQQNQKNQPSQNKGNKSGGEKSRQGGSQDQRRGAQKTTQAAKPGSQQNGQRGGDPKSAQQGKQQQSGQGNAQQRAAPSAASRPPQEQPGGNPQYGAAVRAAPRTQRDVDADQWLTRVQTDPGSFLRNQFKIEDEEAAAKQGASPR